MRNCVGCTRPSLHRRPQARSPHQLRHAHQERRKIPVFAKVYNCLDQCPELIRACISDLRYEAKLEKNDASYVARQIWHQIKQIAEKIQHVGYHLVQYSLTVLRCQAKNRNVQFRFLEGFDRCIVNLQPAELLA